MQAFTAYFFFFTLNHKDFFQGFNLYNKKKVSQSVIFPIFQNVPIFGEIKAKGYLDSTLYNNYGDFVVETKYSSVKYLSL